MAAGAKSSSSKAGLTTPPWSTEPQARRDCELGGRCIVAADDDDDNGDGDCAVVLGGRIWRHCLQQDTQQVTSHLDDHSIFIRTRSACALPTDDAVATNHHQASSYSVAYLGGGMVRCPPFCPTMKIFYRRLYMKRCVFCRFRPGALPLGPAGGSAPRPRYRLALGALAMAPLCQILNTPLVLLIFELSALTRTSSLVKVHVESKAKG